MSSDLELTVLHDTQRERGYVAGFTITNDMIVAVGGTTSRSPTVLASSDARHFEVRTTPRDLGLRDVLAVGDAVWACGEYGQLARSRDHGATWQLFETSIHTCLFGLAAGSDGSLWMVGDYGFVGRVQGDVVERIDFATSARLTSVHVVRDEVIALGDDGAIRRWRAGQVSTIPTGAPRPLTALAVSSRGTWIVIGDGGFIARSPDGAWFTRAKSGVDTDLEAVTTLRDGQLIVVGDQGTVIVSSDDGRTWRTVPAVSSAHLWSVEPFGPGALIGGDDGLILKAAAPNDQTWRDRPNVFEIADPMDIAFEELPEGVLDDGFAA